MEDDPFIDGPDQRVVDLSGIAISIKYNNLSAAEPCALCGEVADQDVGPALFLAGSFDQVCLACADRYAPELLEMLQAWQAKRS